MGYDIYMKDPVTGEPLKSSEPHFMAGGTYVIGGTRELWLYITYNYADYYYREDVFGEKGIRTIYGMSGIDSIPVIQNAIDHLGDETSPNYWTPTEGNAKRPLFSLLAMAKMRPDGVWDGD